MDALNDRHRHKESAHLREHSKLLARHLAALHGLPDAVVAPLHEPALEADRVAQEAVALDVGGGAAALAGREALELRVELGVAALRQQEQQVQAGDAVALGQRRREHACGELVEGRQLRHVPREGLGVPRPDAVEGSLLVCLAREGEDALGWLLRGVGAADGGRGWGKGVELQELQFCFGEEGRGVGVAEGRGLGFQLGEDLLQLAFGHGVGGRSLVLLWPDEGGSVACSGGFCGWSSVWYDVKRGRTSQLGERFVGSSQTCLSGVMSLMVMIVVGLVVAVEC